MGTEKDELLTPGQIKAKRILRLTGPAILGLSLLLTAIGIGSFFASFGGFEPPRFFWCVFLGIPLGFVGSVMCAVGYLGDVARFVAAQSAPVSKDIANYMGENTQPGVKAVAKAAAEGILEAQRDNRSEP